LRREGHLLQQIDGAVYLGHVPKHVTAIHMNKPGGYRVEQEVGGDGFVGPVKQEAD
jgi:hypothetical protein